MSIIFRQEANNNSNVIGLEWYNIAVSSYGFRYSNLPFPYLHLLESIGHQIVDEPSYRLIGRERKETSVIFQYTLAGEGRLDISGSTYKLPARHGFFVSTPSEHCYYYPAEGSEPWEFVWLKLSALGSAEYWEYFVSAMGRVVEIDEEAQPIALLKELYADAALGKLGARKHETSGRVYGWLMAMLNLAEGGVLSARALPESVQRAMGYMEQTDVRHVTLEELAKVSELSKYHLCKLFQTYVGSSPIDYFRKIKVKEAAQLLRHSQYPVSHIAAITGFESVSYFGKVFRKLVGCSPTEYRDGKTSADVLHFID